MMPTLREKDKQDVQDDCDHPYIEDASVDYQSPRHVEILAYCTECGVSLFAECEVADFRQSL